MKNKFLFLVVPIAILFPVMIAINFGYDNSIDSNVLFKFNQLKLMDKSGKSIGDYNLVERLDNKFDLSLEKDVNTKIEIKGLSSDNVIAKIDSIEDYLIRTEIVAVESSEIEEAIITLPKNGKVDYILHCPDFNMGKFSCSGWQITNIPFNETKDTITFAVEHFTAYAGGGSIDEELMIWDETDPEGGSLMKYINDMIHFFANYINITSGKPIGGYGYGEAYCEIKFNITGNWTPTTNMTFNSTSEFYEYNRTFNQSGVFDWNVLCDGSSQGYLILNATDNVTVLTYVAPNPNVTNVTAIPSVMGLNQETNISAGVNQTNASIETVIAEVLYPNGTVLNYSMSLDSGIPYKTSFSDTSDSGWYNVTIYANDTNGKINNTETTSFLVNTPPSQNETIPNQTIEEDSYKEIDLTPYFSDNETSPEDLVFYITNENASEVNCWVDNEESNNLSMLPARNWNGLATCLIIASDGFQNISNSTIVYINVTPINDIPIINSVFTNPTNPIMNSSFNCSANVTDVEEVISWVNFTIYYPNESKAVDNVNGTKNGNIWTSSNLNPTGGIWSYLYYNVYFTGSDVLWSYS